MVIERALEKLKQAQAQKAGQPYAPGAPAAAFDKAPNHPRPCRCTAAA